MYEDAEPDLGRILKLVALCPEPLQPRAFEILLQGYVSGQIAPSQTQRERVLGRPSDVASLTTPDSVADVPAEVLPRLTAMAKRRGVPQETLAAIFDFSSDPFSFAPVHVPGRSTKERTRRVALLVAARTFLATGRWMADWAEVKAMCTHQNCYDLANFAKTLKEAKGDIFKSVNSGDSLELSGSGTGAAEQLLVELATKDAA